MVPDNGNLGHCEQNEHDTNHPSYFEWGTLGKAGTTDIGLSFRDHVYRHQRRIIGTRLFSILLPDAACPTRSFCISRLTSDTE